MASGVYALLNMKTGMRYVGSSNNLYDRAEQHYRLLEKGIHFNHLLQKAYNTAPDMFAFIILEFTWPEVRLHREQVWMDRMIHRLYNLDLRTLDQIKE